MRLYSRQTPSVAKGETLYPPVWLPTTAFFSTLNARTNNKVTALERGGETTTQRFFVKRNKCL